MHSPAPPEPVTSPLKLDWTQWLYPGPRRIFSAQEMQRAGQQPWPHALDWYVLSNCLCLSLANGWMLRPALLSLLVPLVLMTGIMGLAGARSLWRRPSRLWLNVKSAALLAALGFAAALAKHTLDKPTLRLLFPLLGVTVLLIVGGWWFLTIFRVHQIEARLRELDDQEQHLKLARRLATAQIQPHFLFNTLASIQHWVDSQDPRAGSTLRSFTRYLRATLPMFEHETLSLAEELQIVRSYLEVMQARLGQRLSWAIDPSLADTNIALQLPPGTLLTLVENAIGHGIEPALRGGHIELRLRQDGARLQIEVEDSGVGLAGAETQFGLGLGNTLQRLRQQFGDAATLTLRPAPAGGCIATLDLPQTQP
ncbi:histidine kinase [Paucibacter sp. APW11]|uniref:Histidine kinase n=1 Tax=Roseateles aquae TaxID=3077235 RepID=A0ABU3PAT5_9BURK|nr:histidine kinase [Paucibacter sp. APW11]MDT8999397.1 histidine kinase [Paucibacter sp. APW11]